MKGHCLRLTLGDRAEMQHLYALQVMHLYKIKGEYFIIDDTMRHHTNYCKWIHGVFVLFDHALIKQT